MSVGSSGSRSHVGLYVRMGVATICLGSVYALLTGAAYAMGVPLPIVLGASVVVIFVQYVHGVRTALSSVDAEPLDRDGDFQGIYSEVDALAEDIGAAPPTLYVANLPGPNAFAVGRRGKGNIVISPALLSICSDDELLAVIAHELAHLRNRDSILMVLGQSIADAVSLVVELIIAFTHNRQVKRGGLAHGLATITSRLPLVFVFAISRYREYAADADAARAMGSGEPLQRALKRIHGIDHAQSPVSTLCIIGADTSNLFATHPSVSNRIEQLDGVEL